MTNPKLREMLAGGPEREIDAIIDELRLTLDVLRRRGDTGAQKWLLDNYPGFCEGKGLFEGVLERITDHYLAVFTQYLQEPDVVERALKAVQYRFRGEVDAPVTAYNESRCAVIAALNSIGGEG